jgi:hypothetical protein
MEETLDAPWPETSMEIIQCVVEEGGQVLSGGSNCGGQPGDVVQVLKVVGHLAAVFLGVEQVTTGPEVRNFCATSREFDLLRSRSHRGEFGNTRNVTRCNAS